MKTEPHPLTRRIGRFSISEDMLRDHPDAVLTIMAKCITLRCEHRYATGSFEYEAMSYEFDEINGYFMPPEYTAVVELVRHDDGSYETNFKGFQHV
jgi:hypothetical protein